MPGPGHGDQHRPGGQPDPQVFEGLTGKPQPGSAGIALLGLGHRPERRSDTAHFPRRQGQFPEPLAFDQSLRLARTGMGGQK